VAPLLRGAVGAGIEQPVQHGEKHRAFEISSYLWKIGRVASSDFAVRKMSSTDAQFDGTYVVAPALMALDRGGRGRGRHVPSSDRGSARRPATG
jgi:hypothetical protein